MASYSSSRSSYALVGAFLIATLCACGGGGGGDSAGTEQTISSTTPSPSAEALSAWSGVAAFGLTDGGVARGKSLAIGNDGQAHLFHGTFYVTEGTSTTSLTAFHKPWSGGWDTGQTLGPTVTTVYSWPPMPIGGRAYDGSTVRVDDAGNALATWIYYDFHHASDRDGVSHVFFSRRDASTGKWTSPQILQNDALASASDVYLAMEPSGLAWAVWTERTYKDPAFYANDQYAVFAAKFDPAVGWGAAEKVSGDVEWTIAARIRTDGHGKPRVIIAWNNPYTGESTLWAARRFAEGTWGPLETLAVAKPVVGGRGSEFRDYDLAIDATDDAVAIWREWTAGRYVIRSRHFTAVGGWEPAVDIQLSNAADGYAPQLAMDDAGNAFVAWHELVGPSRYVISTARFEKSKGWTPPEVISSTARNSDDHSTFPKIAVDAAGNAVAIWTKYDFTLNQTAVRANYYSRTNGWGTDATIAAGVAGNWEAELAMSTELAMSKTGYAIAVWWQQVNNVFQSWSASRPPTP